jgi:hypothetical protein
MKKQHKIFLVFILFILLTSFNFHKFYVAIYQINHEPRKKMIQVTARFFVDDMNDALEKKFSVKTFLGEQKETAEDENLLKKYLSEKLQLKVNGEKKAMNFHSKELENNVLICYISFKDVTKIKALEVENTILTELYEEQQNIIQTNFNGEKQSLLLTSEKTKGMLK